MARTSSIYKGIKMNGLWMGRYLRRWNRNTLVPRQPLTNDGPSEAIAAALATPPRLSATPPRPRTPFPVPVPVPVPVPRPRFSVCRAA